MDKYFSEFASEYFGKNEIVGCEIGVNRGDHALRLLQTLNLSKIYLIDSYPFPRTDPYTDEDKEIAKTNLSQYSHKIIWIYKDSIVAADHIKEQLDFVYIDGSHYYQNVKSDLERYYPLLKIAGVLAGHDYYTGTERQDLMGVKLAVDEFIAKNNLNLFISNKRRKGERDWWAVK